FAAFVEATGYETEAERFGWSFVFLNHLPPGHPPTQAVQGVEWWRKVDGATWRLPHGPNGAAPPPHHPVTQVSWSDARAYAAWAGGRLPTEVEWEHAARGGLGDVPFPWGEEAPRDDGPYPCNIWQGRFPVKDTGADGYDGTAPVESFTPNGYGLFNMVGNVWEWTADAFRLRSLKREAKARQAAMQGYKVLKGGSFLCHASYCFRYRIAARTGNSPDSTTPHQGFRLVYD
ncbi:MAG: SUMF1/EgtB/PvdO family nonheme iron enzyme, partial [Pseudomonadota bacterium]